MGQGSGRRFFIQLSSDAAGYSNADLSLMFGKNESNKKMFQIFEFLIIAAGL